MRAFIRKYKAVGFIVSLATTGVVGVILLFNVSNHKNIDFMADYFVAKAQAEFRSTESNYINLFNSTLEALKANKEMAQLFMKRDREGLLRLCRPIFDKLKEKNGITHWYFINPAPAKTCFLRVHAPHKYGDVITRATLDRSVETGGPGAGKELGKTAFAIRLVHPYYYDGELIGYMELGMELEHLFNIMKSRSNNEYGVLAKKELIDKEKWASVRMEKNISNNWDDLKDLLVIYRTNRNGNLMHYKGDLAGIPPLGLALQQVNRDKKTFVRGIFPIKDAAGNKVGGIFILKDITRIVSGMQSQKKEIVLMVIAFMTGITFFMIFFHKRAEKELRRYRNELEDMIKDRTRELEEINKNLNREIEQHKRAQEALKEQWKARMEAEKRQSAAVKLAERSSRLASIGVMAAGITHEINQPLNAIKVTADSIKYWEKRNPGSLPGSFVEQLSNISLSVDRISEIIEHMRTFWVIPDTPSVSVVDLNKAVTRSLSLVDRQLVTHGITYRFVNETDSLLLKGNTVHLEQIVVNLIVNAMQAVEESGNHEKTIEIRTLEENDYAVLRIRDTGTGLPVNRAEELFDPFFSTKKAGEGMGLGLAIVKNYVDRYGGTIKVSDNSESGVTFSVSFPVVKQNPGNSVREK